MRRALCGQFLCVCLVIPIVVLCGPDTWDMFHDDTLRKTSNVERKNTVRHMMQMMAITEEEEAEEVEGAGGEEDIPPPWDQLHRDERLRQRLVELLEVAGQLDILDWGEYVGRPPPSAIRLLQETRRTLAKPVPDYGFQKTAIRRTRYDTV